MEVYSHQFKTRISPQEKNEVLITYKGLADYVVFHNTDIGIIQNNVADLYIKKMQQYDLSCIFYGFSNPFNQVFNNPNYAMEVVVDDVNVERFVRFAIFDYVVIDNRKDLPKFRTEFQYLDFNLWLQECAKTKLIPFNGIYFEIENSYNMFTKESTLNKECIELRNNDAKIMKEMNIELQFDNSADNVFKFLKSKKENK